MFQADPGRFAAVITDLMMPLLGGRELAKEIRRLAPSLPIIVSRVWRRRRRRDPETTLLALGVKTLLRKPYTETELLEALGRELEPGKPGTS